MKAVNENEEIILEMAPNFLIHFLIDGQPFSTTNINLSNNNSDSNHFSIQFQLGHQPEFSPRTDYLWVDQIEIFTWEGAKPFPE